jgi:hypothetical protein
MNSLAPVVERQRLSDPPKVEPATKPLNVEC